MSQATRKSRAQASPSRQDAPTERLSSREWTFMHLCWRLGSITAPEAQAETVEELALSYQAVHTFLTRMAKKGYLKVDTTQRPNRYTPAVDFEPAMRHEIGCFLDAVAPDRRSLEVVREVVEKRLETAKGPEATGEEKRRAEWASWMKG
jgi:predicted transcriptional regulator